MSFEADSESVPIPPEMEAQLRAIALDRASAALSELKAASSERDRFYELPRAAMAAYEFEQFELAAELADEALAAAPKFEGDWNYGNAVHYGHAVRGLLALREGNTSEACDELLKSGTVAGSPQLDSFGPSMRLARELLVAGRNETVLNYLEGCRTFWTSGAAWLDVWESKIRAGTVPNFMMHLYR
jgi:hypothetical protein